MLKSKQIAQGDLLFVAVDTEEFRGEVMAKDEFGRYILARGEATGHVHAVAESPSVEIVERGGNLYLKVLEDTEVTHETAPKVLTMEHGTVTLTPGTWQLKRQFEWDQGARLMAD
jgi:hypothetical protein